MNQGVRSRGMQLRAESWPMLLLLLVVVVPTIGVLWFVSVAVRNEELANQQRLTDAYRSYLAQVQRQIDDGWTGRVLRAMPESAGQDSGIDPPLRRFNQLVNQKYIEAAVLFDADGNIEYPKLPPPQVAQFDHPLWQQANWLEHEQGDIQAALKRYQEVLAVAPTPLLAAFSLQAVTRCRLKLGETEAGIEAVQQMAREFPSIRDPQGRHVLTSTELLVIELSDPRDKAGKIIDQVIERVQSDSAHPLPAWQRLFVMKRLNELVPGSIEQREIEAESLSSGYVAAHPNPDRSPGLRRSQLNGIWQLANADGTALILLNTSGVVEQSLDFIDVKDLPSGTSISVVPPTAAPPEGELQSMRAGPQLPGWRLSLANLQNHQRPAQTHQQTLYVWIGLLVVLCSGLIAISIGILFRKQIRVANLKNDLVGTVSHELKTPLSSMRLLVETLLEKEELEPAQTKEYLQLIAKENLRLSRLIENFLTYSRMERGKHTFDKVDLDPADLVSRVTEAAGSRFNDDDCRLTVVISDDIPMLRGDADSLLTALLNLLDNAYKYSLAVRQIELRVYCSGNDACFSVTDNGIGMTRSASRRVFQKFYQVDQSLVREGGGCGLGLSIVNEIVGAHDGSIDVQSTPGEGSTFTIRLPAHP